MSRPTPLFDVRLQGDLINTVSVDRDRDGKAVITLGYGSDWRLCLSGSAPALRYIVADLGRQLDQIIDGDLNPSVLPVVDSAELVADRRRHR